MKNKENIYYYNISNKLLASKELNSNEKILFAVIDKFSKNTEYGCFASNQKLVEIMGVARCTIQRAINKLISLNYISITKKKIGKKVYRILVTSEEKYKIKVISSDELAEKIKQFNELDYNWLEEEESL